MVSGFQRERKDGRREYFFPFLPSYADERMASVASLTYTRATMRLLYKRFLRTACAIGTLKDRAWVHFPRNASIYRDGQQLSPTKRVPVSRVVNTCRLPFCFVTPYPFQLCAQIEQTIVDR
jgi:hypothetical protein